MQRVRGIIAATLVGLPLSAFLWFWLHAPIEVAVAISLALGIAIFAIVATRSDAHDEAADVAWRQVAPDLPPASDRVVMERDQISMLGPEELRGGRRAQSNEAAGQGANPK